MRWAVKDAAGDLTGVLYDELSDRIRAHHERFDETLEAVSGLSRVAGGWEAIPPSIEDERARMSLSYFQVRETLREAGLLGLAEAAVQASGDGRLIRAFIDGEVLTYERLSPSVLMIAAALDLSDEELDEMFRSAKTILL